MTNRVEATPEMCAYCFDVLLAQFNQDNSTLHQPFDENLVCPMFVTLNIIKRNQKQLRGCIGTLSARPLSDLNYFVQSSAFRDKRFSPLEFHELTNLSISVSLLVDYEPGENYLDWEVFISSNGFF
jgi:AMME syndrome candidate gene 1 protein